MGNRQNERPIGCGRARLLCVAVLLIGLLTGQAIGQIFPDPKMTKAFENRLEALAKSHTRVFVSDCNLSQVGGDKAILVLPVGSSSGTLVLVSRGNVYNGAGVAYDAKGAVLLDPGGGEWSRRRLQDIADQLSNFRFALMQPEDVTRLISAPSSNNCVEPTK
jgi:hypothetical protein